MTWRVILEGGPCDGQALTLEDDPGDVLDVLYAPLEPLPPLDTLEAMGAQFPDRTTNRTVTLRYTAVRVVGSRRRLTDPAARFRYVWVP